MGQAREAGAGVGVSVGGPMAGHEMQRGKAPELLLRTYTADMRAAGLDIGMAASVLTACLLGRYHGLARGLFGTEVADAAFAEAVAEAGGILLPRTPQLQLLQ